MATRNRNTGGILDILLNNERFSIVDSGRVNIPDTIRNLLNRTTGPHQREKLIVNTAQKLGKLFDLVKSWNSTLFQVLSENSRLNSNSSHLLNPNKVSEDVVVPITLDLVIYGGMIPIVATLGIILNVVGMYVLLNSPRRKQVLTLLLLTLLVFNIIFLICEVVLNTEQFALSLSAKYRALFHVVMYSAIRCSGISSIFMLVTISHLQLCAIRKPFDYNNTILSWKEKRNVWAKYFLPVIILSIILTLPILVEFDLANEADPKMDSIIRSSSERLHPLYSVFYVGVLNLGILGVSPTAYLTYIACQIRRELKKSDAMLRHFAVRRSITKRKKRRTDRNDDEKGQNDQITISLEDDQNDNRTTRSEMEIKALKAIRRSIFVFIVFHSFRITTTLGELYIVLYSNKDDEAFKKGNGMPYWFESIASLSDLFMVINASLDGIIYINLDLETKFGNFLRHNANNLRRLFKKQDTNATIMTNDTVMIEIAGKDTSCQNGEANGQKEQEQLSSATNVKNIAILVDIEEKEETSKNEELGCVDVHKQTSNVAMAEKYTLKVNNEEKEEAWQNEDVDKMGLHQRLGASRSLNSTMSASYSLEIPGQDQRRSSSVDERAYKKST